MKIVKTNTSTQIKAKYMTYEIKRLLDTQKLEDLHYRSKDYIDLLCLKSKYPTTVDIAYYEEVTKHPLKFPKDYKDNLELVSKDSISKYLQDSISTRHEIDFEKTKNLRKVLINNDRFSLDYVKPKLDSKWQKFVLKFKSFF